ncbi:hypothetical protein VTN02DRAFT_4098 [Thermoascus thermophilus]
MKNFSSSRAVRPWKHICESRSVSFALARRGAAWAASCRNGCPTGTRKAPLSQWSDLPFRRSMIPMAFSKTKSTLSEAQADRHKAAPKKRIPTPNVVQLIAKPLGRVTHSALWLRDNCQCSKCIHPETRQRSVDTFSIPGDVKAEKIDYGEESVQIHWSDGHDATYPYSWLKAYRLRKDGPTKKSLSFRPFESVKAPYESLPAVSYDHVMGSDEGVLEWLDQIVRYGFSLVKGVPVEPESTKTLLERIAFIRHTHYGGFWDFTSDLTFKDTAYTSDFLDAHTDNTYFTDPARLQLFHLLSHTDGEGGSSLLVDGFKAASIMMKERPVNCEILCSYPQPFHASGNEDAVIQPAAQFPIFNRDPVSHRLYQIRWNNYDRAPKINWGPIQQQAWYSAARHWNEIISRPEMRLWTQLEPGTALIFDNWRMLHGRSDFTGKRRMCGGYINNDDFISRYRLLKVGRENTLNQLAMPYAV